VWILFSLEERSQEPEARIKAMKASDAELKRLYLHPSAVENPHSGF
jgi:hypothetical protein